ERGRPEGGPVPAGKHTGRGTGGRGEGMSGESTSQPWSGSASLALRGDAACLRFEEAWAKGERPPIEHVLAAHPEADASVLLWQLLLVELELRLRAGEAPAAEDYRARFLGHADLIDAAFRKAARLVPPRGGSGVTPTFTDAATVPP